MTRRDRSHTEIETGRASNAAIRAAAEEGRTAIARGETSSSCRRGKAHAIYWIV